ncbi:ras-related protein Rab-39B-like [Sinocyclocheilus anshuiensis]|uniref:Ras-related protein Rab-39B-like n=1 Tax=Sinocyclocheilus anshuiensis TaxID=1608454 RepID=A0A671T0X3_9TELE|nr:PREDICTED: ras-related protein Rab-39B-like [Sinocyclocheilus anshuiensis]
MNGTECLYGFKIIMIGDGNVGKSCILYRYLNGLLPEKINCTIGVDFCNHILEVEPGVRVQLQIWDTTGHEAFWNRQLIQPYIPHSAGCLLVFDLGNRKSFRVIKHQYTEVCNTVNPYTVLFVLVGHKCDRNEREVNQEEVEQFASELGVPYIEASAITGHNVAEAFELWARRIYQGYLSGEVRLHERWGKIHENKTNKDEPAENSKCCVS